ncbi:MAG: hypothetical protein HYX73_08795 [Acidobacteria bacterium]|nr:hypothetical protein [Acidobacteriota bacterium]
MDAMVKQSREGVPAPATQPQTLQGPSFILEHHKAVSAEYIECYKIYMQSWTIVVSALVVGVVFGLRDFTLSDNLQVIALAAVPLIFLLWVMLTAWFWAYFAMYREYLCALERAMRQLGIFPAGMPMIQFHSYRESWFRGWQQRLAEIAVAGVGFVIYIALAWVPAAELPDVLGGNPLYWAIAYFVAPVVAIVVVAILHPSMDRTWEACREVRSYYSEH